MNYNFGRNALEKEVGGGEGSCPWPKPCDGCRAAPSVVYCRADAAYLCASCDTRVHAANSVASRHERVRVCEACERAPAVLVCRADAAALCAACDAKVHSANPLAGRHQRVPVVPLPAAAIPAASVLAEAAATTGAIGDKEEEVDSWLLLSKDSSQVAMVKEQQQSGYGVVGAEQAASITAGVSAYTDSISNSVSSSNTTMLSHVKFFFLGWIQTTWPQTWKTPAS